MLLKPERFGADDFQTQPVSVCGKTSHCGPVGCALLAGRRRSNVADLHLEKASAFAARGQLLPPYDTRETLSKLAAVIDRFQPETLISLGDSLHDCGAAIGSASEDLETLAHPAGGLRVDLGNGEP